MKQFYETYSVADEKLSPVLRELVPEAEKVFRDQYVMEFIGCQKNHQGQRKADFRNDLQPSR